MGKISRLLQSCIYSLFDAAGDYCLYPAALSFSPTIKKSSNICTKGLDKYKHLHYNQRRKDQTLVLLRRNRK